MSVRRSRHGSARCPGRDSKTWGMCELPAAGGVLLRGPPPAGGQPTSGGADMDLQAKLREAMKSRDDLARDLLRVVLGEVSTRRARAGKEPSDEEVHGI